MRYVLERACQNRGLIALELNHIDSKVSMIGFRSNEPNALASGSRLEVHEPKLPVASAIGSQKLFPTSETGIVSDENW